MNIKLSKMLTSKFVMGIKITSRECLNSMKEQKVNYKSSPDGEKCRIRLVS